MKIKTVEQLNDLDRWENKVNETKASLTAEGFNVKATQTHVYVIGPDIHYLAVLYYQ